MPKASASRMSANATTRSTDTLDASHSTDSLPKNTKTSLHEYLTDMFALPVELSVPALSDLLSTGLRPHLTYTGARVVIHPLHDGSYSLNNLARAWMGQGRKLQEATSANLSLRLLQHSQLSKFQSLYAESKRAVKESRMAWFPAMFRDFRLGCPCCMADPLYCVPLGERCDEALSFRPEVWGECFGSPDSKIGMSGWSEGGELQQRFMCSESMLKKAIKGEVARRKKPAS